LQEPGAAIASIQARIRLARISLHSVSMRILPSLFLLLLGLPALAQSASEDVITLHDGAILRGHVTVVRPGIEVEIVLLDGRAQIIPCSDIATTAGPSFPVAPPNLAAQFRAPGPNRVPLLVESTGGPLTVGVMRTPSIGETSMTIDDGSDAARLDINYQQRRGVVVCETTPCQLYAPPGHLVLQASGRDILSYTADLDLPVAGARVSLRAPSASHRRAGVLLVAGSLGTAIAGAVMAGVGASFDRTTPALPMRNDSSSTTYYGIGGALIGSGVVMAIVGGALWASGKTGVEEVKELGIRF
jgi:hypothetical protein